MSSYGLLTTDGRVDDVLDQSESTTLGAGWMPACDVWHDEDGFTIQLALPGWRADQLDLEVDNRVVTIQGERPEQKPADRRYHRREIGGVSFSRIFTLPAFVDPRRGRATHRDGLLTVSFPKRGEAAPRRILIEV